jgi:hypothetical protein
MKYAVIAGAIVWAATLPAFGQSQQDVCAAYAKRAVQQYQLMKSHPGCDQHLDALSWRDDYSYHYNGCMTFGKIATTLSDQGRDGHLRACGAITDSGDSGTASATAPGSAATTSTAGAPAAAAAATGGSAPAAPAASGSADPATSLFSPAPNYGGIGCHEGPALASRKSGNGRAVDLKGNALSYHAFPPAGPTTTAQSQWASANSFPLVTAFVARPQFFPGCKGIPAVSALGPWVEAPAPGQSARYIWVDVGGTLAWQEITAAEASSLVTTGKLPSTAAAPAAAAKPAKAPTPAKAAPAKAN